VQKIKEFLNSYYGLHLKSFLKTFIAGFITIAFIQIEQGVNIGWETFWLPAVMGGVRAVIKISLKDI